MPWGTFLREATRPAIVVVAAHSQLAMRDRLSLARTGLSSRLEKVSRLLNRNCWTICLRWIPKANLSPDGATELQVPEENDDRPVVE